MFNRLKTVILLASLSSLLLVMGNLLGGAQGLTLAFVLALLLNGTMYFFSDKIVLGLYGAQKLPETSYSWIYETVADLAHDMRLPMPKLWLINTPMANAFATGRSPQHSSVAVTTGIISILTPQELRAVLAHELSHIQNRDILVSTIAATLATAIGYCADFLRHRAFWGGHNSKNRHTNVFGLFALAIFMPLVALLIRLGISRSREFLADETGAHACKDPLALARALEKLHTNVGRNPMDSQDTARAGMVSLFIVNPLRGSPLGGSRVMELFSTHPAVTKRIERLYHLHQSKGY